MNFNSQNIPVYWCEEFVLELPAGHRFPMEKYRLLPEQLIRQGIIDPEAIHKPSKLSLSQAGFAHENEYLRKLGQGGLCRSDERRIGFPYSTGLINRELLIAGATLDAARRSLECGLAFTTAGGTHHAGPGRGEGFCLLNDIAVAGSILINEGVIQRVLIVDFDVHQGNGSAEIFQFNKHVFTLSIHAAHNFPLKKAVSDMDVALADGTGDLEYLSSADRALSKTLENFTPDLIFYQAGVDILSGDKLGRLNVSKGACRERDRLVFQKAKECGIPVVVTMGGGYSVLAEVVNAHAATFEEGMLTFS